MNPRAVVWGAAALAIAFCSCDSPPSSSNPQTKTGSPARAERQDTRPQRVIIRFRANATSNQRAALHASNQVEKSIPQLHIDALRVPTDQDVQQVISRYRSHPLVEYAEAETFREPALTPNDPWFQYWQIPLQQLGAEAAWDLTTGSPDVPIAVLDTGLDVDHFEFAGRIASGEIDGYDFADDDSDFDDPDGHGTVVTGVISAMTNNGAGVAGATWQNPIVVLRTAFGLDTIEAITWATDNGARVISMSFGGSIPTSWEQDALQYAFDHGVVLVGSAGNEGTDQPHYPAAYPIVLAVTGVSSAGDPIGYNWGDWIDVSAPGGGVLTTRRPQDDPDGDGIGAAGGTSIAAPFVAAAAGLVLSANPALTPTQVMDIIRTTADDVGEPGFDPLTGWGRVNFHAAVLAAMETDPPLPDITPPSVAVVAPADGEVLSAMATILVSASDDTGVSRVDLYVDGSFVSSDTVPPHEWAFDTTGLADGPCTISAEAFDAAGNHSMSDPVQVTIDNPAAPACDSDGVCDAGEDCELCPGDCFAGEGAGCGNGLCEAGNGEDCLSCPADCNGRQTGRTSGRFCCGDGAGENPVDCGDSRCQAGEFSCTDEPVADSCCGDGLCSGTESGFNCEVDCGPPPVCGDGLCEPGEDCQNCPTDCAGRTGGRPSQRFCCGNGVLESAEKDWSVCDGHY